MLVLSKIYQSIQYKSKKITAVLLCMEIDKPIPKIHVGDQSNMTNKHDFKE